MFHRTTNEITKWSIKRKTVVQRNWWSTSQSNIIQMKIANCKYLIITLSSIECSHIKLSHRLSQMMVIPGLVKILLLPPWLWNSLYCSVYDDTQRLELEECALGSTFWHSVYASGTFPYPFTLTLHKIPGLRQLTSVDVNFLAPCKNDTCFSLNAS